MSSGTINVPVKATKWFLMIAVAVAQLSIFVGDGEVVTYNTT